MLILGVHPGYHEAAACLFDEYRMLAAVSLERLTRKKIDGGRIPIEAIDECLSIAGVERGAIDVVALGRGAFPWRYYNHFRGGRLVEGKVRQTLGKEKYKSMERELARYGRTDSEAIFRSDVFLADLGLRADATVRFFNHHLAHALPSLFHTDWDNALLYTSDGGGDNVQYSHRVFRDGQLTTLHGGDEALTRPMRIDSLGLAYGYATQALGYRINRHEGKLTGLAAYGEPERFEQIAAHFSVDDHGAISSDFENNPAMRQAMFDIALEISREAMAASIQAVLEHVTLASVRRLLERHDVRNLGLSGGVFGNVLLNQRLAEGCDLDDVFVYPAMSDQGLPAGGVFAYLLERDGLPTWLDRRHSLDTLYFGRNFDADADAVLSATPGITKVSDDPVASSARLIAESFDDEILAEYPNVDGVIALKHGWGCGMSKEAVGYSILRRTIAGFARHPNIVGFLLLGLGCEIAQVSSLIKESGLKMGEMAKYMTIQETGGTMNTVREGAARLKAMLPIANAIKREPVSASHIILGLECGGSDAFSGLTANPALGAAVDLLVRNGGTGVLGETPEIYGAEHLLVHRAETKEVGEKLLARVRWWEDYTERNDARIDNNPSPGNKVGGLTTILEKSLGAVAKGGKIGRAHV